MTLPPPGRVVRLRSLSPETIAPIFVDLELRNSLQTRGRFAVSELQGLNLVRATTRGEAFQVFRRDRHIRQAPTHDFFACLPLSGAVALAQEGRSCLLSRGDIGLMDSRLEYSIDMPGNLDSLWIRIPRERLESRLERALGAVARRIDGSNGLGMIASRFILSSASQADQVNRSSTAPLSSMIIDLLCAAATSESGTAAPRGRPSRTATLERARDFIEHNLGDENLSPSLVASGIGISTRYLGELFAEEGLSTMAWITRRRLEFCRTALDGQTWTSGVITEVAFRHGFDNLSSFNRAFKTAFGTSPRAFMRGRDH